MQTHQIKRIAYTAANAAIRGKVISIQGFRVATSFDIPRVIVKLVKDDGSLEEIEWHVAPGIIIDL